MRISICLVGAVMAIFSVGCFSPTDPLADVSAADSRKQVAAPIEAPAWEANSETAANPRAMVAAVDPKTNADDFDLSDLDDIAPSLPIATNGGRKTGFSSYQEDLSLPAFPIASREARKTFDRTPPTKLPAADPNLPIKVELREAGKRDLDRIIASFYGKIVFVDFWASWCGPCVGSFPNTVRMHRLAHQHDLRVITVSLDKPIHRKSVLRFLESHQATCVNLLAKTGGLQPVSYDFGIPGGSIPHFKLYDRQGTQRHDWTGAGPDVSKDILRRVVELLNEK